MTILKTFTTNIGARKGVSVEQLYNPTGAHSDNQRMRSQELSYRFKDEKGKEVTLSSNDYWKLKHHFIIHTTKP